MGNGSLMIGVSTRQNTANLVPFFQLSGEKMILLETDLAKKNDWSMGIKRVIEGRGKECDIIPINNGTDLCEMETTITETLEKELSNHERQRIWSIFGGGQKLQQLAQFNHFKFRLGQGQDDMACYTEPQEKLTYIISPTSDVEKQSLKNTRKATDCLLDLNEILSIFGHESKRSKCLWRRVNENAGKICGEDYFLTNEQEQWFDDYHRRQAMFSFMLKKEEGESLPEVDTIFPINFQASMEKKSELGEYFERLMQTRITRIIAASPEQHRINQVWANVHVYEHGGKNEIAEYDLVLVTNFGTIIPMDAKSYDFAKKDEDARRFNLNNLSGVYTDFWAVFPYYQEDLKKESILQKEESWKKLLRIPFALKQRRSKMLSLSGVGVDAFYVFENKKNKINITKAPPHSAKASVKVNTLTTLIDTLNLKK